MVEVCDGHGLLGLTTEATCLGSEKDQRWSKLSTSLKLEDFCHCHSY